MEAHVLVCKCNSGKIFGMRTEKRGKNWVRTWAFPLTEQSAKRENYESSGLKGNFECDAEYPGCPYCGSMAFYQCSCGKLVCWDGKSYQVTCPWCKSKIQLAAAEQLNVSASDL